MKRKRQIIIQLAIIIIFGAVLFHNSGLFITPEEFLYANEMGLHYGPSDEIILKEEHSNGDLLIIGKIGDDALSIGEGKRVLMFFWGMPGGGFTGYRPIRQDRQLMAEYLQRFRTVVGLTDNKDIKEVEFNLRYDGDNIVATERASVDDKGFFRVNLDDGIFSEIEEK